MTAVVIIPARYESTRFPGKPLAMIRGAEVKSDKPYFPERSLVNRTWEVAVEAVGRASVYVATDHIDIADHVREFGGVPLMTSEGCRNGTERCAEAAAELELRPSDVVVNLQGDALLTPPEWVRELLGFMVASPEMLAATVSAERSNEPALGEVSVVTDRAGNALYFSRAAIPSTRGIVRPDVPNPARRMHFGLYAYRVAALNGVKDLPAGPLERTEGLEQLRFLEYGIGMHVLDMHGRIPVGEVNYPEDVETVEKELVECGLK